MVQLVDAHTHVAPAEQAAAVELATRGMWQLVAATRPDQCSSVAALAATHRRIVPTYGLHPWYAGEFESQDMDEYLRLAPIIGEIGLDTVWATTPLGAQRRIFQQQLELAVRLQKPVLLHTKGAEEEILHWLRRLTPPAVVVHWYSGPADHLPGYLQLGCYFTLGPDIAQNGAVQEVCRLAPLDRLLTETDGPAAVTWATGGPSSPLDAPQVLLGTLAEAAKIRGVAPTELQRAVYRNLLQLLSAAGPTRRTS